MEMCMWVKKRKDWARPYNCEEDEGEDVWSSNVYSEVACVRCGETIEGNKLKGTDQPYGHGRNDIGEVRCPSCHVKYRLAWGMIPVVRGFLSDLPEHVQYHFDIGT